MGQASQPTNEVVDDHAPLNNEIPRPKAIDKGSSDTPEVILGIQKRHLPKRFERYFLDDDIILFNHRTLPKCFREGDTMKRAIQTALNPSLSNAPPALWIRYVLGLS